MLQICLFNQSQTFACRVAHQLDSKEKLFVWRHEFELIMVWIKEKGNELESMDDLESSLVMLEEAASKFEVRLLLIFSHKIVFIRHQVDLEYYRSRNIWLVQHSIKCKIFYP